MAEEQNLQDESQKTPKSDTRFNFSDLKLDEQFIEKFFAITDRMIPDGEVITLLMLKDQAEEINTALKVARSFNPEFNNEGEHSSGVTGSTEDVDESNLDLLPILPAGTAGNVLVIDDLGVITYQLGIQFRKYGFEAVTSREIYDAIEKYKKQEFDVVIMDLCIPTEREGLILLDEIKKLSYSKQRKTILGIMSASSKKEHKNLCKTKGAEFYIEKNDNWQRELFLTIGKLKKAVAGD